MALWGSARIARGVWVSGGAGFATSLLAVRLVELSAMAVLLLLSLSVTSAITAAVVVWRSSQPSRRALARQALAAGVHPSVVRVEDGRSDPPVWGVYLVGHEVHTGPHPMHEAALARLYPDRRDTVCTALMPDTRHAAAAARELRRLGFSAEELKNLFAPTTTAPAAHGEPASAEFPGTGRSRVSAG
jgi:hypothetical protein